MATNIDTFTCADPTLTEGETLSFSGSVSGGVGSCDFNLRKDGISIDVSTEQPESVTLFEDYFNNKLKWDTTGTPLLISTTKTNPKTGTNSGFSYWSGVSGATTWSNGYIYIPEGVYALDFDIWQGSYDDDDDGGAQVVWNAGTPSETSANIFPVSNPFKDGYDIAYTSERRYWKRRVVSIAVPSNLVGRNIRLKLNGYRNLGTNLDAYFAYFKVSYTLATYNFSKTATIADTGNWTLEATNAGVTDVSDPIAVTVQSAVIQVQPISYFGRNQRIFGGCR